MTRLVRKAALLGACGLFIASVAGAAVPDPAHSTVPAYIFSGGVKTSTDPTPDPGIAITIVVRDFLNNPIVGSNVELNYSQCADTKICTAVVAGTTVDPVSHTIRLQTGAGGIASMTVMGASINVAPPAANVGGAGAGCIKVYADGIQLAASTSVDLDQNGAAASGASPGVNGADVSFVFLDIGRAGTDLIYRGRADYSKDGVVNGADAAFYYPHLSRASANQGSLGGCRGAGGVVAPYWP